MNYAFRVGLTMCSAVLRLTPGCKTMEDCNAGLLRHAGPVTASHNALPEGTAHLFHGTHFDSVSMAEGERNAKPVRL